MADLHSDNGRTPPRISMRAFQSHVAAPGPRTEALGQVAAPLPRNLDRGPSACARENPSCASVLVRQRLITGHRKPVGGAGLKPRAL